MKQTRDLVRLSPAELRRKAPGTKQRPCLPFESGDNTLPGMEAFRDAMRPDMRIPQLAPHEGSWVVTLTDGAGVVEIHRDDARRVEALQRAGYVVKVETITAYLGRVHPCATTFEPSRPTLHGPYRPRSVHSGPRGETQPAIQ